MTADDSPDSMDRLDLAMMTAVRIALHDEDPAPFLDWLCEYGLGLFIAAGMIPQIPREDWRMVGTTLGRAIWNHLPRPDNDFRPRRLPEPGRNDPCPCGSGRKFKLCCGETTMPPMEFPLDLLLPQVLRLLPRKALAAFPHRRFNPELLAAVTSDWLQADELERARVLLEPLFADSSHLDGRHAMAFDILMDIYADLGKPRKRKELLATGVAARDPVLRSTARQRQAAILLDSGDTAGAWAAFQAAMRDNPDDPSLAALEISMLEGMDEPQQLQERARFWATRLKRRPDAADLADLIGLMERTAADPDGLSDRVVQTTNPALAELAELVAALPPIASPPRITLLDGGVGVVEDRLPASTLSTWVRHLETGDTQAMHDWLRHHPVAWDSLAVLDHLLAAVTEHTESTRWLDRHILAPLFARARTLVDAALAALPERPRELPWGLVENRPLHRLLVGRVHWLLARERHYEAAQAAEELLAWNPQDNPGVRDVLAIIYAQERRWEDLLGLADRYADDIYTMGYYRVLALFALERRGEALAALTDAARQAPKVLKMLLATNPRPVRPKRFEVLVGGEYQAWLYRQAAHRFWEASGALDWARQCAPAVQRRR